VNEVQSQGVGRPAAVIADRCGQSKGSGAPDLFKNNHRNIQVAVCAISNTGKLLWLSITSYAFAIQRNALLTKLQFDVNASEFINRINPAATHRS
jgi:hypothetical protein